MKSETPSSVQTSESARRMSIHSLLSSPASPRSQPHITGSEFAARNTGSGAAPASNSQVGLSEVQYTNATPPIPMRQNRKVHPIPQLQSTVGKGRRNKKHVCEHPDCGREFSRKSNLEAHNRKHMTGEKATPYSCCYCSRRFKWRSSQKSHEAGCMHQSLPAAIKQQEEKLSKQREKLFRQRQQKQQDQKREQVAHRSRLQNGPANDSYERALLVRNPASSYVDMPFAMSDGLHSSQVGQTPSVGSSLSPRSMQRPVAQHSPSEYAHFSQQDTRVQSCYAYEKSDAFGHAPKHVQDYHSMTQSAMLASTPRGMSNGMLSSLRLPFPGELASTADGH